MLKITKTSPASKIFCFVFFLLLSTQLSFAQSYSATEIYAPGFENLTANALSDNGMVVGVNNGQSTPGAFLWNNGTFTDLGAQYYNKAIAEGWNYATNTAMGVNNNGLVIGYATTQSGGNTLYHPLVWEDEDVTDLYNIWSIEGRALAVNNNDFIVNASYNNGGSNAMALINWREQWMIGLNCLPCIQSVGFPTAVNDINQWGQVVGKIIHPEGEGTGTHGFYWNGTTTILGSLGNSQGFSAALDINNSSQIVGISGSGNDEPVSGDEAFLWINGTMTGLGTLPGSDSSGAFAINDSGKIVGTSGGRAVLWENGQIIDLNDLFNLTDLTLISALDINSEGKILALAQREDGSTVNALLSPIPEPSAFLQLLLAGGMFAWVSLRKKA